MAIYHLSAGVIQRSAGRSACANAAYIGGKEIYEERRDLKHSYVRKRHVVQNDILTPEGAPEWASDSQQLWNKVENFEDYFSEKRFRDPKQQEAYRNCAQTAQT